MKMLKDLTLRKKILLGLLVPAVGMLVANFFLRDEGWTILFSIYVIPVMTLNAWEWFMPELMEDISGRRVGIEDC